MDILLRSSAHQEKSTKLAAQEVKMMKAAASTVFPTLSEMNDKKSEGV
jgi:hypothetical protein